MNKIIDGKEFSKKMQNELMETIANERLSPALIIGMIGNNPASATYVRNKKLLCEKIGILPVIVHLDDSTTSQHLEEVLLNTVLSLKETHQIGVMVQLPVPNHIDLSFLEKEIFTKYDVEGVSKARLRDLYTSTSSLQDKDLLVPCTARGVVDLLNENKVPLQGETVLMIGRSNIVGAPLTKLLTNSNSTVIHAHSYTPKEKLIELAKISNIIIVSVGSPHIFGEEIGHDDLTIIDVGIHRTKDGKLIGDVNIDEILNKYENINYTPVPGGIGPVTVAELMKSMITIAREQI